MIKTQVKEIMLELEELKTQLERVNKIPVNLTRIKILNFRKESLKRKIEMLEKQKDNLTQ